MTEPILDKPGIIAAIHRNGETLKSLGLKNGLAKSSCSAALHVPVPTANKAIAKLIGHPVHKLWPQWYNDKGERIFPKRNRPGAAQSQETRGAA